MNPTQITQLKEESLRWIFSILGALLVYLIAAAITLAVYHPDIDHLRRIADQLLMVEEGAVQPEPMEAMLFRLGIITILPSLCIWYMLLSRTAQITVLAKKRSFLFFSVFCVAAVLIMTVADFAAENTSDSTSRFVSLATGAVKNTNFNFFFDGFFLGSYFPVYTLIIVPLAACLFFIGFKKYHWDDEKGIRNRSVLFIGYIVTGGVLLGILLMNTFEFPYSFENKYDFAAVYYSMTQVFAGSPMLVDGFTLLRSREQLIRSFLILLADPLRKFMQSKYRSTQ